MLLGVLLFITAAPPEPQPVVVPARLREVTRPPELSGLVWSAALDRYLVVSDDTGLEDAGTNHAPFVLAMSAEGTLDDAPVAIVGLDALNDAESICAGPAGTFFLLTSHSANREGRTRLRVAASNQFRAHPRVFVWLPDHIRRPARWRCAPPGDPARRGSTSTAPFTTKPVGPPQPCNPAKRGS